MCNFFRIFFPNYLIPPTGYVTILMRLPGIFCPNEVVGGKVQNRKN